MLIVYHPAVVDVESSREGVGEPGGIPNDAVSLSFILLLDATCSAVVASGSPA